MKINPQKSDLICYNSREDRKVDIGNSQVNKSEKTKHLGITRNESNVVDIEERIKAGRATIYGLLGAGLQIRKGFSPVVSHNLWKVYALPRIVYGLEVMMLKKKDIDQLEVTQRKIIRQIQGLPSQTANTASYVLIGAIPTQMVIERNMLSMLMNILRNQSSVEYQIIRRQLAMKDDKGHMFVSRIENILEKYNMGTIEQLMCNPNTKEEWKKL